MIPQPMVFDFHDKQGCLTFKYSDAINGKMVALDNGIAKLYFETQDEEGNVAQVPVPDGLKLIGQGGIHAPRINHDFFLSHADGYRLVQDNNTLVVLITPKRQYDVLIPSRNIWPDVCEHDLAELSMTKELWEDHHLEQVCIDSGEEMEEFVLKHMAGAVALRMGRTNDTYNKALDIFKSYKYDEFKELLDKTWPDKNDARNKMWSTLGKPKEHTVEDVCFALYLKKSGLYL